MKRHCIHYSGNESHSYLDCCPLASNVTNASIKRLLPSYLQSICQSLKTHEVQLWVLSESNHCLHYTKATQV